ncbi:amino acid adenylation domain-containing protein [Actinoplanes sp. NPDC026670]|uniref:amino acid adenylation domain-containing protein n=1 Tax=Actinoplanes sp. NPDC026670 TaxID=3154700 RepID=UPI0033D03591
MARFDFPDAGSAGEVTTLAWLLRWRAVHEPDRVGYVFLDGDLDVETTRTYGELDRTARAIAVRLRQAGLVAGDRALLLYLPGVDFVSAFFGCLYAGVIAVPAFPPDPMRFERTLPRLLSIIADAGPAAVLTTESLRGLADGLPDLGLPWLATDGVPGAAADDWTRPAADRGSTAMLQYTSGSTGTPKGVMLTHGNLLHNSRLIQEFFHTTPQTRGLSWLPPYHDMGLIGCVLQPLFAGLPIWLMSPLDFLRRPQSWLEAVSKFGITMTGGPNFAYDLCVRRTTEQQRAQLSLGTWQVAFNGAEPVRRSTMQRFAAAFAPAGFRAESFLPCYGLAEATLIVSGGSLASTAGDVDPAALGRGEVAPGPAGGPVSCGPVAAGQQVAVVDPESRQRRAPDRVGEIWLRGPSVAAGYWERPAETHEVFHARIAGAGDENWLRTGDLGFVRDGELIVTGRLKDLIIIRGRNHYPQDLEVTAERTHPALRPGCAAAFTVEHDGTDRVVLVHEVTQAAVAGLDVTAVAGEIRRGVAEQHGVQVALVVLIPPGALPKTSSGKVQRAACRTRLLAGDLPELGRNETGRGETVAGAPAAGREQLLAAEADDRTALMVQTLRRWAADACGIAAADLAPESALLAAGLDSLAAQQLGQRVEQELGVVLPLADVLAGATLADLAGRLAEQLDAPAVRPVAEPAPAAAPSSALSPGQRALWFLHRLEPDSTAHTTAAAVRLTGPLDEAALTTAFDAVLHRHSGLRTNFVLVDGEPVRLPGTGGEIIRSEVDPQLLPARLAADANRPFDLADGPLVRLFLYRLGSGEHAVLVTAHHIATDFWSTTILARELAALYTGQTLPPVPEVGGTPPAGGELLEYWKQQYGAGVPRLELPARNPSGTAQTAGVHRFRFDGELLARLRQRAVDEGVTVNVLLLAGYQALLHRLTGQDDVVVGTPLAARARPGADSVVGYLMNPVLIRSRATGTDTFRQLLRQARAQVIGAIEHQDLPSALLAEQLTMPRYGLFQAMFVFNRPAPGDATAFAATMLGHGGVVRQLGDLRAESLPVDQRDAAFDLELAFADLGDTVHGSLRFRDDVLDLPAAQRFVRQYTDLLEVAATDPGVRLGGLPRVTDEDHDRAVRQWNATEGEPSAACVPELFAAQVRRTPDDVAVQAGAETITYSALSERAAGFAARLQAAGAGPGARVGIVLDRSPDLVAALLGVLRAGAAYVPVDPMIPPGRIAGTFADAGVTVVLSHSDLTAKVSGVEAPVLFVDGHDDPAPATGDPAVSGTDVAYLIYTSGSTGEPKGVEVSHASLVNFTLHAAEQYGIGPQDRVLQFASVAFDTSAEEIFPALLRGARVVLRDDRMLADPATFLDACATAGVTVLDLPTAYWHDLVAALGEGQAELPGTLRLVVIGGERALPERVALWHERVGSRVRLINTYGPTEATIVATTCELTGADPGLGAPIGRPVTNTRAYLLDDEFRPVPVGVVGELYLGGAGLAYGYRGRPALTAARFVADPFGPAGARLYRTGDLSRYLPDGAITFVARADRQIKLNGYRVEPGEVETALRRLPGVTDAAVVRHSRPGQLLAYVTPASVDGAQLRAALRAVLPGYMVPAWCVPLAALPRTPNGKIDYAGLPPVGPDQMTPDASAPGEPPRTPQEHDLAAIWCTVLEVPQVNRHDDFFALGGHSLLATRMLAHVNHQLGVDLPLRVIFEAPTLAAFAARVAQSPVSRVAPVPPAPRDEPLPLSFVQERIWFLHQLQPGSTNYNVPRALRLRGHVDLATVTAALADLEVRHEILRTVFPDIDGEPVQVVLEPKGIPVALVDRRDLPAGDRDTWLDEFVRTAGQQPFDLVTGPLLRVNLVRLADDEYVLVVVEHHLIHDGWTQGVFLRDFLELYEARSVGREANLPHLPVQYADFAVWQRRQMQGERLESLLTYWRERMAGAPPLLELPTDRPRPRKLTTRGGQEILEIDGELARGLRGLGRQQDVTLFMSMFTGFVAVMHGLSGQDDIVLGAGIANRQRPELENLIGMIINTVLLRTDLSGEPTFAELLGRVRETCLDAYAHQDMPFDKLVEQLRPVRSVSHMPLFQVMFSFLDTPMPDLRLPGVTLEVLDAHNGSAKFDLNAVIIPHAEQRFQDGAATASNDETITVLLEYNADLFDASTVAGFLEQYESVLRAMIAQPGRAVGELLARAR